MVKALVTALPPEPSEGRRRPPWLGGAGRKIQIWGPEMRFLTKKFDLGWLPSAHEMGKKHQTRTAVGCFDVAFAHVVRARETKTRQKAIWSF